MNPPATSGSRTVPTSAALRERLMRVSTQNVVLNNNPVGNGVLWRDSNPTQAFSLESEVVAAPAPSRVHIDFQDNATPERNRFFVRRSPSGEMITVKGSPSISISRRTSFSSLVAMCVNRTRNRGFWVLEFGFWVLGLGFWALGVRLDTSPKPTTQTQGPKPKTLFSAPYPFPANM